MDRQDIDALLIGALYGELTPADEARLTAHLESHPGDRGALDDLKVARAAVRESRIFELQHEPPQAVSALLLQEAHRRAPKRVMSSTGEEQDSWFFRFTRMFMAHPAMAAAAMLVVVVGVFGVMRANDKNASQVAEKTYSPSAQMETADQSITNEATVAPTGAAEPAAGSAAAVAMDPSEAAPADEGKDGYNVQLDEATRGRGDRFLADREEAAKATKESAKLQREQQANKKSKGMIVSTPQPQPKELDAPRPKAATTKAPAKSSTLAKADSADDLDYAVGTAGGAGGAAAPRTGTAAGTSGARAGAGAGISANDSGLAAPQGKFAQPAAPPAAAPAPPPPSVATAPSTTSKPTEAKQAQQRPAAEGKAESAAPAQTKDNSLIAWAKSEHNRTVALANKGDCIAAAKLAVVVQNRAPDYYTQYMSTDRALKRCQAYIAQERDAEAERTGKARAQKRVNADEPAPATK